MAKQIVLLIALFLLGTFHTNAQISKRFRKPDTKENDSVSSERRRLPFGNKTKSDTVTTDMAAKGLKEALAIGSERGIKQLSSVDGFFKDAAIKILLPPEAVQVEKALRKVGMGKLVDEAILSMNRAAEDAAKGAANIFGNTIKEITIQDVWGILRGGDAAATEYLKGKTTPQLTEAFRPVVEGSLNKVNATKHWNNVITAYNKVPLAKKINPDLTAYVTERALSGIFHQLSVEEKAIREDPVARTTDLLKNVFGK
ncbi:DUF4197 domain-containing protein [Dyadobacter crusticola]|uniref:DUF4197 domain-containing protein n=1 Tax=Dyadobacter crusticola TaxID=292407 RepID=UPI0004E27DBF|nr:DUF4197 domain-containing protein [Dyadobacter crusticola]